MSLRIVCRTVGELVAALAHMPPETVPFSYEHPPFDGCLLTYTNDGKVMISGAERLAGDGPACSPVPKPTSDRMAVGE